jgi:hypothetical protein
MSCGRRDVAGLPALIISRVNRSVPRSRGGRSIL